MGMIQRCEDIKAGATSWAQRWGYEAYCSRKGGVRTFIIREAGVDWL